MSSPDQEQQQPGPSEQDGAGARALVTPRLGFEGAVLAAVACFGLYFLLTSQRMIAEDGGGLGPGSFPLALATGLLGLVGIATVLVLRTSRGQNVEIRRPLPLLLSMGLLIAFVPIVQTIGYVWTIVPWTLAFALCARVRAPFLLVITLATVLFVAFVIFEIVLGTPLP